MEKTVFHPLLITICSFILMTQYSCVSNKLPDKISGKIENKITSIYREHDLHGDFIIGIVNKNGLVYSHSIHHKNSSPINNNTPFYIASHTKALSGTLFKILSDANELGLDESLYDNYSELTYNENINTKLITIRDLLTHTSGVNTPMMMWKTAFLGYENQNDLSASINDDFRVDTTRVFRYSNTGPIIASMVLNKKLNTSWKDELKSKIFEPLKMDNSSAYISDYKYHKIRPAVFKNLTRGFLASSLSKTDKTMSSAGGVISTVNDLSKWLKANINKDTSLLSKESWKELHEPIVKQNKEYFTYTRHGYSLGWDIATYKKDTIITRFGGWGEISFHLSYIPSLKIGVIAYSSDERAFILPHLMANYAYNLISKKENSEAIFTEENEKFEKTFNKYNNKFSIPVGDILETSKINDSLIGNYKNDSKWPDIIIKKKNSSYIMSWGELSGVIHKKEDLYILPLGVITRKFTVKNGQIKIGSLIYKKMHNTTMHKKMALKY